MTDFDADQMGTLKGRFRDAGCTVTDLTDSTFGVLNPQFPVRTHVEANPYYLGLGTVVVARPRRFIMQRDARFFSFLNMANTRAKIVKFTSDGKQTNGQWTILATTKFVTGTSGFTYETAAIKNLVLLWIQDVAEMIATQKDCPYEIAGMMQAPE